ncbi:MAG TPA: glycosyltransferase family 2 protein [Caulobacteraceae bacterium]|nr:glycosyltransferase family 2 protein [Caulobacteraceae bacterium]
MAREAPEGLFEAAGPRLVYAPPLRRAGPLAFGGADRGLTRPQVAVALFAALLLVTGLAAATTLTLTLLHHLFFAAFAATAFLRLGAAFIPRHVETAPPLRDEDLPAYTVICPLYREAEVAPELVAALERLDYPRDRLQVLVMLEADDLDTRQVFADMSLPSFMQVLVAPPGIPRTKPRACNVALARARGEYIVIYDAEDRPDPRQLREAAERFAAAPASLACLQAPLRIEFDGAFLPAQFALEYAAQFEVLQPALAKFGAPFPLGGTSNHFRTSVLREVGGWDPYNVTEDADLGFRLARGGHSLGVLASPTWETAPRTMIEWLPQRTRWVKGYMQTFGVHTRGPNLLRPPSFAALLATLGVSIASAFAHGPVAAWVLAALAFGLAAGRTPPIPPEDLALLLAGWSAAAFGGYVGLRRAGLKVRLRDLALSPAYWPLQSLAAGHALVQLVRRPFHWDKTPHAPRAGRTGA